MVPTTAAVLNVADYFSWYNNDTVLLEPVSIGKACNFRIKQETRWTSGSNKRTSFCTISRIDLYKIGCGIVLYSAIDLFWYQSIIP
eukprot:scaffold74262_cov54-Attheya_sp.AAC.1